MRTHVSLLNFSSFILSALVDFSLLALFIVRDVLAALALPTVSA